MISHKIYTNQISLQKSETHILLSYWKQPSRDVLQNASSEQFSKISEKFLEVVFSF